MPQVNDKKKIIDRMVDWWIQNQQQYGKTFT